MKVSYNTSIPQKNTPGSAQLLSHTTREGASLGSKQKKDSMCKSHWRKGKYNGTLSSLAPQWSRNELCHFGNWFFHQFKKLPRRFQKLQERENPEKRSHFLKKIILGKPKTQIKIMLKECQSFLCTSPHSHGCLYTWCGWSHSALGNCFDLNQINLGMLKVFLGKYSVVT